MKPRWPVTNIFILFTIKWWFWGSSQKCHIVSSSRERLGVKFAGQAHNLGSTREQLASSSPAIDQEHERTVPAQA